ncbi:MAG: NADH-ubiquinone oxidoreductase-F iron-sulfur binding region domain-containing protein [Planctomycetota bacterium]|jgi:NADH-quinone oxidoreductase subunit F
MKIETPAQLLEKAAEWKAARPADAVDILVCGGPGCLAVGAADVAESLRSALAGAGDSVRVKLTGCQGLCEQGTLVTLVGADGFYRRVKAKDAEEIARSLLDGKAPVERLLFKDPQTKKPLLHGRDVPFYARQKRTILDELGRIDPLDVRDAVVHGAYSGLAKVLSSMTPEQVIDEVVRSGLRGRGGAGFPTGRKWRTCRDVDDDPKYVICNADEGDPGAFMDRSICEGNPHAVLEGMVICAFAVGSSRGYIYVREEYPLAVERLAHAVEEARGLGLLGEGILGSGFSFDVEISRGGGAFVCGESSALMKSVAGEVGEPRAKYVRSVVKGLFDKPTVLNNVETFANVPAIVRDGGDGFASTGTGRSTGTKVFSLVGAVKNTGLVEVEMGTTLRQIIYEIGGGIRKDRPFKAVQTGGPSGGCLPEDLLDLPVDFDSLTEAGSMMGSGGMIVTDDRTCMVDVARYFTRFLMEESCGKCVPCREGVLQLYRLLQNICDGQGKEGDVEKIEKLSRVIQSSSLCQLGVSAPNPVLSTLKYFRDEYDAHVRAKNCPAGICKNLTTFEIDPELCDACGACKKACPADAIEGKKKEEVHRILEEKCTRCGACRTVCPKDAIITV